MNNLTCPYCSSTACKTEYRLKWRDERFANYEVARCKSCDLGFVLPLPTPAELDELYNSLEYQAGDRATTDFSKASQSVIDAAIKREEHFLPKYAGHLPTSGHVLDIGAGWGTLLKQFANQGYRTTGLELSEPTSEFAKNALGLNIHNKPTE